MLSALILVPLLGAALIGFLPITKSNEIAQPSALVTAVVVLLVNIVLGWQFDTTTSGFQFEENIVWIEWIGFNYHLGIDGLSLPLIFLNSLLTIVAIVSTNKSIERPRFYYSMLLLLSAGAAGAFLSQDLLLFFLFYELEIIPLYFLIAIWGGKTKRLCSHEISALYSIFRNFSIGIFLGFSMVKWSK